MATHASVGLRLAARHGEWETLMQALPFGVDRWRFIALDGAASGVDDLIVIGVNASAAPS